jgi:hypothetical protein
MELVSLIIFESSATQFLVTIPSQQGLFAQTNPSVSWEVVSVTIFELAATPFLLAIAESTGTVCADESRRLLGKQCR